MHPLMTFTALIINCFLVDNFCSRNDCAILYCVKYGANHKVCLL